MTLLSDTSSSLGKWLLTRRQRLPLWFFLLSILALLIARPFWIVPDSLWLNIPCLLVAFGGIVIRMLTVGYTPPGAQFQTQGMYAVCRHPLELGSFLIWSGILAYTGVLGWILCGLVLRGWLIEKILTTEETALCHKFGPAYYTYAISTSAILPLWKAWQTPQERFSWRRALRLFNRDLLGLLLAMLLISIFKGRVVSFGWTLDSFWIWTSAGTLILLFISQIVRKLAR